MSSGDFEAELQQSVNDHLALIATAASAAKARIGEGVASAQDATGAPTPAPASARPSPSRETRPAVDFSAPEPDYDPAFAAADDHPSEADAFVAEPAPGPLPEGGITFDDFAVEGLDDEGIPVWEDPS